MADVSTLVIIGASGDLTQRLLLPALADLLRGQPQRQLHLVGVGRTEIRRRAVAATSADRVPGSRSGRCIVRCRIDADSSRPTRPPPRASSP
ncbi:hypothetical protein [Microbacterium sp. B24]|uniref:hypothetical protein n=1 Tax=Microbacterium sp. B24 TaxID=95616 RepID=UPI000414930D|nr:hypothetical protein [Microbacterium sp. B24]